MELRNRAPLVASPAAVMLLAGCDPIINIQGAFFPAWVLCIFAGLALAGLTHRLLVAAGLQPYVGPIALVYPCIALCWTMVVWLVFFQT
jgi:hypothetical protein